ncbi:MAG: cbb3-type cytochrome c oxidase subunit I [Elusimicrobiota bacterium]|nr:cbb3-type cytochrome c oxidase subunit I [Elusimicrobiota bacterium]
MEGLKKAAIASFVISMLVLLGGGWLAKDRVPPYPLQIISEGTEISGKTEIIKGQNAYQRYGLMDLGSVWGHGTLRGLDFSATTLNLTGRHMREYYAEKSGKAYAALDSDAAAAIDAKVIREIKTNNYDPVTGVLTLPPSQAYAFLKVREYWREAMVNGDNTYGLQAKAMKELSETVTVGDFFFWTAWAAGTLRPGENSTYTNNWPPDVTVGNAMMTDALLWSVAGILAFFIVLGIVIYAVHRYRILYGEEKAVETGSLMMNLPLTLSQVRAAKFFVVVTALFILQTCMGGLLAHYTVSPGTFFPDFIATLVPYSWAKSWHLQLAIFWIATTWIGASIYLAPVISGKEPKGQGLLVNILFVAVVLVAVGSLAGTALGAKGYFTENTWFWFGHQGWEFLESGRFWQWLLFVGLIAWLVIVYRGMKDKLFGADKDNSGVVMFYLVSAVMVVGFFGFGFFYGKGSHLTISDYWRWFVVHLWVEGIFEFFGVAIISLFLVMMGLVKKESAMRVAYFSAILVFASGIIGTAHHYFWYGGPSYWLALGAVFASLEPIPMILLVVRAWKEYGAIQDAGKDFPYRWPLFFLTASSFWNFLGAGMFGFSINLPIINYFEHGTYLTANHGHAALFGVYGMLSISLMLFSWRSLVKNEYWNNGLLKTIFWLLNGGLFLMVVSVLLPEGLIQTFMVYKHGVWFARSPEFYNMPVILALNKFRIVPDTIIITGAILLGYFLASTYFRIKPVKCGEGEDIYYGKSCKML